MDYREFLDSIDRKAYHEGEWRWQEGDLTVTRTNHWSPPGCHNGCGVLLSVDKDGKPQVGPKGSLTALDDKHLVWSEVTFSHLWENIKNGSKVAVVVADVPSHTNVRVVGSVTVHEGDDFAKEYAAKVGKPETAADV